MTRICQECFQLLDALLLGKFENRFFLWNTRPTTILGTFEDKPYVCELADTFGVEF